MQLDNLQKDLKSLHDYVRRLQPVLQEIKQMAEGVVEHEDGPGDGED